MNYQKFIEGLADLYENWNQESVYPKSNHFQSVIEQVKGKTTSCIMQLLNSAVAYLEDSEIYCEFGCKQGENLIAALLNHSDTMAYAVDNFYEFDKTGEKFEHLRDNISMFGLENQVAVYDQELEEFFLALREAETEDKIGLFFYNGASDYRSQLLALLLVKPFLARKALILLGNSNLSGAQQASLDFTTTHPQCMFLLELPALQNKDYNFGNGVQILSWDFERNHNYGFSEIKKRCNPGLIQTLSKSQAAFEAKKSALDSLWREALELHHYGKYEEAEKIYKEILEWDQSKAEIWLNLGMLYYATNRDSLALDMLLKAVEIDGTQAAQHYNIALVLEKIGDINAAMIAYQKAIALAPEWIEPYSNLGNILLADKQLEQAETLYRMAIAANPNHFGSYLNLGNVLVERHQLDEAIENYEKALSLKPRDPDILYNWAVALDAKNDPAQAALHYGYAHYRRGEYEEAIQQYQQFLTTQTGDLNFYIALADCYKNIEQYDEAINTYREGIKIYPKEVDLYWLLAITLQNSGRTEEGIKFLSEASESLPDSFILKLEKQRLLPVLYDTEEEIEVYRRKFSQGLEELIKQTSLTTFEARNAALKGLGATTNFYLQYQGKNDVELQKQYGQFVHQIMAENYPQWAKQVPLPPLNRYEKIRVGYISHCLRFHTVGRLMLGWLRNCNRQDFEVYCYHCDRRADSYTSLFRLHSDTFYHIPENLEAVCQQIIADKLHILVFIDIGMYPRITQVSGLRLAPVQCTTWGHPITSGSPTIDYFLSSELMEPENAQAHYTEKLVCLPNIGISYAKPTIPESTKKRCEFVDLNGRSSLREDAVLYLSCQSLFKYLPQYDYVFAAIAQQVPQAQFAFLYSISSHLTEKFRQRLQCAFAKFGLNSEDYCVILPKQNPENYLQLNLISDVFLDTFSWSGGHTTLEAVACNLPVVTCPGEFMRGRHSYGILRMLGVTDTIAQNEAEYIEIAVRLGLDRKWRDSIVERIVECHSYLYEDKTCVEHLEEFYRHVVKEHQVD